MHAIWANQDSADLLKEIVPKGLGQAKLPQIEDLTRNILHRAGHFAGLLSATTVLNQVNTPHRGNLNVVFDSSMAGNFPGYYDAASMSFDRALGLYSARGVLHHIRPIGAISVPAMGAVHALASLEN